MKRSTISSSCIQSSFFLLSYVAVGPTPNELRYAYTPQHHPKTRPTQPANGHDVKKHAPSCVSQFVGFGRISNLTPTHEKHSLAILGIAPRRGAFRNRPLLPLLYLLGRCVEIWVALMPKNRDLAIHIKNP